MATLRPATAGDVPAIVRLAARTLPLAAPPGADPAALAAHIETHLGEASVRAWVASGAHRVIVAEDGDVLCGYALVVRGWPSDPDVARAVGPTAILELSKVYVDADRHGSGVADALMAEALAAAADLAPGSPLYLGTNLLNRRAQAFYRRHGFTTVGARTYLVGGEAHDDVVMLRPADGDADADADA